MNCPVCDNVRMREVQKNDVMIDICPQCKGVWLDRGELEKLMEEVHVLQQYSDREDDSFHSSSAPAVNYPPRPSYPPNASSAPNYNQSPPPMQHPQGDYREVYREGYYKEDQYKGGYYKDGKYKQGYPYKKKKKSMFDVFEDLFD